jgi:hypothetical protein
MKWNYKSIYINLTILLICIFVLWGLQTYSINREPMESQGSPITNNIDVIYYINLDIRPDRNEEILSEIKKTNYPLEKVVRISGELRKDRGALGCSLSHIKALTEFVNSSYNTCIIFEDDFEFITSATEIQAAFKALFENNIDFDVCMLSANEIETIPTKYPFINKVKNVQTASGYIVSRKFAPTLLQNYIEGAKLLENDYEKQPEYAIDQYWKRLQPMNNWYLFQPKLGKQRDSYSNIQGGFVKMSV